MATEVTEPIDIADLATALGEKLVSVILGGADIQRVKSLLNASAPVWYQTEDEGISALHAAAFVQDPELVRLLLENGAVWNAVDHMQRTAGDIALSFNNEPVYRLIRDAGIRSELLLDLLQSRDSSSTLILSNSDRSALSSTDTFLGSKLKYVNDDQGQDICLLEADGEEVGVMMGWERGIMEETVKLLTRDHPNAGHLHVLNVGFGLGIFDGLCQSLPNPPERHVIIEAHPDVLQYMKKTGWYEKPGVTILEGKWQDFIDSPALLAEGGFDVVYTDTFSEDYAQLRSFFRHLPSLLSDADARFSFFNGLGATNPLFYDVYRHVSDVHLDKAGLTVKWGDVDVIHDAKENRWGNTREYFSVPLYRLPIGTLKPVESTSTS